MKNKAIKFINALITEKTTKAELDIIKYIKRLIKADNGVVEQPNGITEKEAEEYFNKTYAIYPRKVGKIKAKQVYMRKLLGLEKEMAREKALQIYKMLTKQVQLWGLENNGSGRPIEYTPYFSSWINANVT